jgi:hypothetical protein
MSNIANVALAGTFRLGFTRVNEGLTRINSVSNTNNSITANNAVFRQDNSIDFVTLYNDSPASVANESRIVFKFNDDSSEDTFGWVSVKSSDITNGSENADMEFAIASAGASQTKLTLAANGQLSVPLSDNYENTVVTNNVITNKKYVDDKDTTVLSDALALAIALG